MAISVPLGNLLIVYKSISPGTALYLNKNVVLFITGTPPTKVLQNNQIRTVVSLIFPVSLVRLDKVLVLNRLGQFRMESAGFRGTKTVPVPGSGEPNIQGTRT